MLVSSHQVFVLNLLDLRQIRTDDQIERTRERLVNYKRMAMKPDL